MDNYPFNTNHLVHKGDGPLVCHGCAHSAGAGAPYPGRPSGERPCHFCIRNVRLQDDVEQLPPQVKAAYGKTWTCFYNNAPMKKCPMDCYISTDRVMNDVPDGAFAFC